MERGDLANLTAFVAVADQRSFRAAASRLGVTPSALSHSMRQLEERLGVRLLHRTTRSVSATDAGRRLLDQLRPMRPSTLSRWGTTPELVRGTVPPQIWLQCGSRDR